MFLQIHPSIWVLQKSFSVLGQDVGSRMTIIKLKNGDLWLHSPVQMSEQEHQNLAQLGPVKYVVSPNLMHYIFLQSCLMKHPEALVYGVSGLEQKLPGLSYTHLDSGTTHPWSDEIDFLNIEGMPSVMEAVFLHIGSRTLVLTDLALHIHKVSGPIGGLLARVNQSYKTFGPSRVCKLYIQDHVKLRNSVDEMLRWDFDRVIVSHGEIVQTEGKEKLQGAYNWLSNRIPMTDRVLHRFFGR